jgi:arginine decarboxylase
MSGWGTSYFGINEKGDVYVTPCKDDTQIDLHDVMDELSLRDITPPVLLRFPDILDNRIEKTWSCFKKASDEYGFTGENFIIYPIKVNQMQPVVEEIISHGRKFNLGLEAGSKPELHAVIAVQCQSDSLIICNGYKDQSYIELALLAQKMGKRIFIVVEKLNELEIIAKAAKKLNVRPNLGIRIKLASSGSGKWEESGGDASKFGLTSSELLKALEILEKKEMKDCLRLIHFHIGSQITKIRRIQTALREASQFYIQLHKMGYNVDFVDCGGGLGVDYDGTRSPNSESSVNYSIQEYVNDCIYTFVEAANRNGIQHPNIITESGRSLSAHHSVLVIDVLETASLPEMDDEFEPGEASHPLVKDLYDIWDNLNPRTMLEDWHDAEQIRDEALDLFSHGIVDLQTRAEIERMYWSVCREINSLAKSLKHTPEELKNLDKILADKYFCNFSLFQSLPDAWAVDQLFPIVPLQRLNERPTRSATLQDITCDSDGKITNFVTNRNISHILPVHTLRKNEPYYLGVFLVGAYQEILGDMHNLFGDTNAAHITVKDGRYHIDQIFDGETVEEVLNYVQYNPKKLVRQLEVWVTKSVKQGKISLEEGKEFLSNYRSGLYGYTYLE